MMFGFELQAPSQKTLGVGAVVQERQKFKSEKGV